MPSHNIIDNRREKLVGHINLILETNHAGRVGLLGAQLLNEVFY